MAIIRATSLIISVLLFLQAALHLISIFTPVYNLNPNLNWTFFIVFSLFGYAFYSYGVHQCWINPNAISFKVGTRKLK